MYGLLIGRLWGLLNFYRGEFVLIYLLPRSDDQSVLYCPCSDCESPYCLLVDIASADQYCYYSRDWENKTILQNGHHQQVDWPIQILQWKATSMWVINYYLVEWCDHTSIVDGCLHCVVCSILVLCWWVTMLLSLPLACLITKLPIIILPPIWLSWVLGTLEYHLVT